VTGLRIALVYPELLGTYGDGGNALVAAERARARGYDVEVVAVPAGEPVPDNCDLYLLGGGEDEPQVLAAEGLRSDGALLRAVERGAVCLAVCAGLQIVGVDYTGPDGVQQPGLGLLPLRTQRAWGPGTPPRAVGDLAVTPTPGSGLVGTLYGYENHGGRTRPVEGATGEPLGYVPAGLGDGERTGVGNGTEDRAEGWITEVGDGLVVATYLHGPVLAQNPELADLLLARAAGVGALAPFELPETEQLRGARRRQLGLTEAATRVGS
jgi:CobQ-like glutamine amidotransferase family enzyme